MALRLRRGTDVERLAITPLEGELVYTTDTKKVYIGDGSTTGGVPIDSDTITNTLSDLTDVDTSGVQDGDTLVYNSTAGEFQTGTLATSIGDLTDVDTTGVALNDILKWNGSAFVPADNTVSIDQGTYEIDVIGDLQGSVFADDSSLVIDGITGRIFGDLTGSIADSFGNLIFDINDFSLRNLSNIDTPIINVPFDNDLSRSVLSIKNEELTAETELRIVSSNQPGILKLTKFSETDLNGVSETSYGRIYFERDDINGSTTTGIIAANNNRIVFAVDNVGSFSPSEYITIREGGLLGIGTEDPTESLDVRGNGTFTGSVVSQGFIQFGSYTDIEIGAITPQNGMVYYNTTANRFRGYQNGQWINIDDGTSVT